MNRFKKFLGYSNVPASSLNFIFNAKGKSFLRFITGYNIFPVSFR